MNDRYLSVYDGDLITAEKSYIHYTTELGNNSIGVVGLFVNEYQEFNLGIIEDREPYKEHITVDYSNLESDNKVKTVSKKLANIANKRGFSYKP